MATTISPTLAGVLASAHIWWRGQELDYRICAQLLVTVDTACMHLKNVILWYTIILHRAAHLVLQAHDALLIDAQVRLVRDGQRAHAALQRRERVRPPAVGSAIGGGAKILGSSL